MSPWKVLFCGSVQIEHRAHKLFQAIAKLAQQPEVVWLLSEHELEQAEELVKEFDLKFVQLQTGRDPFAWQRLVSESGKQSIAVHTHFSVYGQTAPYLQISLSAGLPTLISDFGGAEFLSDSYTFKIEPGETEATQMNAVLQNLIAGEVLVPHDALSAFAQENFSVEHVAKELEFALHQAAPAFAECNARFKKLHDIARKELTDFALSVNFGRAEIGLFGSHHSQVTEQLRVVFQELGFL